MKKGWVLQKVTQAGLQLAAPRSLHGLHASWTQAVSIISALQMGCELVARLRKKPEPPSDSFWEMLNP